MESEPFTPDTPDTPYAAYGAYTFTALRLDDPVAREPALTGAKAANLARAAARGLPVLPGFVVLASPPGDGPGADADSRLAADAGPGSDSHTVAGSPPGRDAGAASGPGGPAAGFGALQALWRELAGPTGDRPLVVRSSSAHEDTAESSMAGRFASVLDVRGWDAFTAAVARVLRSAEAVALPTVPRARRAEPAAAAARTSVAPSGPGSRDAPAHGMAVLVQPMLRAAAGGVMFGADPVQGRYDRLLVSAVTGGPDKLVDGSTQGVRYQLTRRGRVRDIEPGLPRHERPLGRRRLARLARLARRTEKVYGAPQDVEFGFDGEGRLWLFQARPITAMAARPARGARLLGPGPVAETLPGVLQPLEEDLWLAPMDKGLALALDIAGAAPRRQLRRLPVVRAVGGRAAADLRLLGAVPLTHPVLAFVNPAPGARRAAAAWRVGRLRAALPLLARDLMADVDRQLHDLAAPHDLLGGELLDAIAWGRTVLVSLHAQESLAGALLDASGGGPGRADAGHGADHVGADHGTTAAGEALAVLAEGRAAGHGDEELIAQHPVLLTLLPPTLGARPHLPARVGWNGVPRGVGFLSVREGLRLRIRWVQEMQAAMVAEVGARMDSRCRAGERRKIALLRWHEVTATGTGGDRPADLAERSPRPETPPLPAAFRLADGQPVAVPLRREPGVVGRLLGGRVGGWLANRLGGWLGDRLGGRLGGRLGAGLGGRSAGRLGGGSAGRLGGGSSGQGAGGGQGSGTAWDGVDVPPARPVLVVRSLDPALAPLLPELSGLVAETGSVLSHMAVLAREYRVPTVVGVPDAVHRFPPGTTLTLDGGTGAITVEQARDADGAGPDAADERSSPAAGRDGRGGAGPGRGEAGPGHADARAEYADAGPGHGATGGGGPDGRSERGDLPTGERGAPAGDVAGAHKGAAA